MLHALRIAAVCTLLSGLGFSAIKITRGTVIRPGASARGAVWRVDRDEVRTLRLAWETQWGRAFPPPGTPCWLPWDGFDAHGSLFQVGSFNCFESVCYLTSGDPGDCGYRTWPTCTYAPADLPAAWPQLQSGLHRGDVVEFVAQIQGRSGTLWSSPFHAQICAADGGLMFGANNEPRFVITHGVPKETMRWDFCTTREYYDALKGMDQAWRNCGEEHAYSLVVHKCPEGFPVSLAASAQK